MTSVRLYRALLHLYPAPFRHEYGEEMAAFFLHQIADARRSANWWAEASAWLRTLADLAVNAPKEHAHVLARDVRYALRLLAAQPVFATVAILSLALGIGANTAIFSVLHAVAFKPLPVSRPHQLVLLTDPLAYGVSVGTDTGVRRAMTYAEFEYLRERTDVFSGMMASQSSTERLPVRIGAGPAEETVGRLVSADYFSTLGVDALLGHAFRPGDSPASSGAVISHDYWQRRFGKDPGVLGTRLVIRDGVFSIIGVAPPSFQGETVGERTDLWLPLLQQQRVLPGRDWLHDRPGTLDKVMWLRVFGRLRPEIPLEQAQAAVNVAFQQSLTAFYGAALSPEARRGYLDQRIELRPGGRGASPARGTLAEPLTLLLAAAGAVLLIACANLGNLMLARAAVRTREIAVRLALGAARGRIARQLFTESVVIAVLGGVAGVALASGLRRVVQGLAGGSIHLADTGEARVLLFAFALTLVAGIILGLLPAMRARTVETGSGLREQGRGVAGSRVWQRASRFVIVGQVALSLPLLVAAGLLSRTFENLRNVDLGYAKDRLLMVRVDVETAGYAEASRQPLFDRLLARVRTVPGVRAATYSKSGLFLQSDSGDAVEVEGYSGPAGVEIDSRHDHVGPGYFSTLGIPLLTGREITERDGPSSERVCVINEAFSRKFFAGRNPIGRRITQLDGEERRSYRIVGVAANSRKRGLRGEIEHRFFVSTAQPMGVPRFITLIVRTGVEPARLISGVRQAILSEDAGLPVATARALEDLVDDQMAEDRMLARIATVFGAAALLLAAIGLYGALSYSVARRTHEIGIRKALGAGHGAVLAMVLSETGWLLGIGLALGAALSAAGAQWISSRLYGLAPADPMSAGVAVAVLSAVAVAAVALPAYRASRVDPLIALRSE